MFARLLLAVVLTLSLATATHAQDRVRTKEVVVGFGVQPPTPAWGSMMAEGRDYLYVAWWIVAAPGAALALTALGVNLLGDWLRDTFDPKLRV